MTAARIMLADDFDPWRQIVRSILEAQPNFSVIAEASDGQEAVEKAVTHHPDIVLLDISMPLINGIEAAKRIKQACPRSKIIFLTQQNNDDELRSAALATGAEAYLLKSRAACELLPAIEAALLNGLEIYEPTPFPSYAGASAARPIIPPSACDHLTSLWRPVPIAVISLAIVMVAWTCLHLWESIAVDLGIAKSSDAGQSAALASLKPSPAINTLDRRTGDRARESNGPLSAFKRVQVGPNEVDYVAEDVTLRVFRPRPVRAQQHVRMEVNIGDDVTVRYFASESVLRPQTRRRQR